MAGTPENRLPHSLDGDIPSSHYASKENNSSPDPWLAIKERNQKFRDPSTLSEDDPKKSVLFLIPNSHIDKAWYWPVWRGVSRVHHSFRSTLNVMDKPDFQDLTFTASSADYYYQIQRQDKGMFNEIRQRIEEGRWGVVGGGWVEPDVNKPSGENLANSLRISQQYFAQELGLTPTVALEADSFGHPDSWIQPLTEAGFDFYMFTRPQVNEDDIPSGIFSWQMNNLPYAIDAERIPEEYTSGPNSTEGHIQRVAQIIQGRKEYSTAWIGIGNHGGEMNVPMLQTIRALQDEETLPQLVFSTPQEYKQVVRPLSDPLVVKSGPLQWHAAGTYHVNQESERLSQEAEHVRDTSRAISGIINWVDNSDYPYEYPHEDFRKADQIQAEQDFHDIRAGTSIEPVYKTTQRALGGTIHTGEIAISEAIQSLTKELELPQPYDSNYFVVMNSHPWETTQFVTLEENDFKGDIHVVDSDGNTLPHQTFREETTDAYSGSGDKRRYKIGFQVQLPPMGYHVVEVQNNVQPSQFEKLSATNEFLENEHIQVTFSEEGEIKSLIDKSTGYDLAYTDTDGFTAGLGIPVICDDTMYGRPVDTWGHGKRKWEPIVKEKALYNPETGGYTSPIFDQFKLKSLKLEDNGPVFSRIRGVWSYRSEDREMDVNDFYGDSLLVQDFILKKGSPMLEVEGQLSWHEKHKMLKLRYPLGLEMRKTSTQSKFGYDSFNENGDEHPAGRWINVTGRRRDKRATSGITFFNDGLSSYSMDQRNLHLTVVASRDFVLHDPAVNDPQTNHRHTDIGDHTFKYALMPHSSDAEDLPLDRLAAEYTRPLREPQVVMETMRKGHRPRQDSFMGVNNDNVLISGIKGADSADGLVFRCYETAGKNTKAELRLAGRESPIYVDLKPHQLITVRVHRNGPAEIIDIPELNVRKELT